MNKEIADIARKAMITVTRKMLANVDNGENIKGLKKEIEGNMRRNNIPYSVTTLDAMVHGIETVTQLNKSQAEKGNGEVTHLVVGVLMVLAEELREERERHIPKDLK